jgi:hypothetical protein
MVAIVESTANLRQGHRLGAEFVPNAVLGTNQMRVLSASQDSAAVPARLAIMDRPRCVAQTVFCGVHLSPVTLNSHDEAAIGQSLVGQTRAGVVTG